MAKSTDYTKMASYRKGYEAYFKNENECPFKSGNSIIEFKIKRAAWWSGYYTARAEDKLGHIINKDKSE